MDLCLTFPCRNNFLVACLLLLPFLQCLFEESLEEVELPPLGVARADFGILADDCLDDGSGRLHLPYIGIIGVANGCAGVGPTGSPSYSASESLEEASPSGRDGMYSSSLSSRLESDDPMDEPSLSDSDPLKEPNEEDDDDETQDFFLCSFLEVLGARIRTSLLSSSVSSSWKFTLDLCSPCCVVGVGPSLGVNGDSAVFASSLTDGINPGGSTNLWVKS